MAIISLVTAGLRWEKIRERSEEQDIHCKTAQCSDWKKSLIFEIRNFGVPRLTVEVS